MDGAGPFRPAVTVDMEDVHDMSVDILHAIDGEPLQIAVAATALTLGRLLSPVHPMEQEQEMAFIQAMVEYGRIFFADGTVN
jgi:hypothetical protein